jgi:septal ring factor EnvC (AmiA/AmiB activator)
MAQHLREEEDGRLTALTKTGAFHIERLRLNRPPLVALRRTRREVAVLHRDLAAAQEKQARLRERIDSLEKELEKVLEQLLRLSGL